MKLFQWTKDGGPESPVSAFFLIEWKNLVSIAFLRFNEGGRETFHSHAFNALTWFLSGSLVEEKEDGSLYTYRRSFKPKFTSRNNCHRVYASRKSWCFTVRGPWVDEWFEITPEGEKVTLTHGRKVVDTTHHIWYSTSIGETHGLH